MKPYNYLLLPIVAISLLASCSKDDDIDNPVSLSMRVAGVSVTRAAVNQASDLKNVGIYAVNAESGENKYGSRPTGTYGKYEPKTEGGITSLIPLRTPTDQTIWLNSEKATIFCCHPAPANGSADITNDASVASTQVVPTVPIPVAAIDYAPSATSAVNNKFDFTKPENDYMYGVEFESNQYMATQPSANNGNNMANGIKGPGPKVNLGLKHAFAQLRLVIKKNESYKGIAQVTSVSYTSKIPVPGSGTRMKLTDGSLLNPDNLANTTEKEYRYTLTAKATTDENTTITITNYAIPCESQQSATISLTVDGKDMSVACNSQWTKGQIYTYTVVINPTGLELTGINVVGWDDNSTIPDITI